jgi:hypothetical protein
MSLIRFYHGKSCLLFICLLQLRSYKRVYTIQPARVNKGLKTTMAIRKHPQHQSLSQTLSAIQRRWLLPPAFIAFAAVGNGRPRGRHPDLPLFAQTKHRPTARKTTSLVCCDSTIQLLSQAISKYHFPPPPPPFKSRDQISSLKSCVGQPRGI